MHAIFEQDLIGKPDKEAKEIFIPTNCICSLFCVSHLYAMLHHGLGGEMLIET
jgi:hypothetical protein